MNSSSKKTIDYLDSLDQNGKAIFTKIKQLQILNTLVTPYLDKQIQPFCQVANLVGNRLIFVAANGSIATQLRFQATDLLRKCRQHPELAHIQEIHCKVSPALATTSPLKEKERKMAPLSAETAAMVHTIAESLEDTVLREIMQKIAGHRDPKMS